ncbi:MAG: thioredoxin domain-containing protein [Solirubrobacterales bacterium]|nr:thioredoxin domain-containing protein [Solirubrobacterales bacterium]
MPNRLARETSPYLLQHSENPVDWYPWGEEALARARDEDRPLLVSIGYSACHWCHVMERESFEDPDVAALMNERFVCVKVDREERPDVDAVCMEACQTMTGQGGWPLNAFLTPEQAPFYVGTYYPPQSRHGLPSWRAVLDGVAEAWSQRRDQVREQGGLVLDALARTAQLAPAQAPIADAQLTEAVTTLRGHFDFSGGGFGSAPKFPTASVIEFLLARGERRMSLDMLRAMARGGIYDQVGGGFARYSVDATWTVPHFEKMLYDNALLARAYLHGWQVSQEPRMRRVCCETLDWALREMRGPEGGFCSALDADSEGVEGKFYVWTLGELRDALGDLFEPAVAFFGATAAGNFEGANVLQGRGPEPAALAAIRERLYAVRAERAWPGQDDKRLTSWNALMVSALAETGAALEREEYLEAAVGCAEFLLRDLRDDTDPTHPRLLRTFKDGREGGRAHIPAYLEDHAYLLEALLTLYEATFDARWFVEALALAEVIIDRFADVAGGGFFTTASDQASGFARRKDLDDSPIPAAGSSAAFGLLRLARMTGEARYEELAEGALRILAPIVGRHPHGFGHALQASDFQLADVREVALVGGTVDSLGALARVVRDAYRPHVVLAGAADDAPGAAEVPLLQDRAPVHGRAAAYVCRRFACQAPVTTPAELAAAL